MLKNVGLFGVRKRLNEIVDLLNGDELFDIGEWVERTEGRIDNALTLFGEVFRSLAVVNHRLDVIEKQQKNRFAKELVRKMGKKLDDEALTFALEAIEGLEARIDSLEEALSLQ